MDFTPSRTFPIESYFFIQLCLGVLIHAGFAIGVWIDAWRMKRAGGSTFAVPGWLWACAALMGGMIPVIGYWFIHHSSLRKPLPPWMDETSAGGRGGLPARE